MKLEWSHMVLWVNDLDAMLDFYLNTLGFEVTDRGPLPTSAEREIVFLSQSAEEHHQIAFVNARDSDGPSNSVNHAAFRIDSLGALRALMANLDAAEVKVRPRSHGNTWSVYFQDPEANGIEIFCDTPWHVTQPAGVAWDPTLSDEQLRDWTFESFSGEPGFCDREQYHARRALERAEH
ncbi:MAG: hypothetical protein HOI95_23470 [Chromatiales bacterium]|jgi:catechol 2,3-dioxygenase|nr:hypothetical protein [Chromatiales bacterium]